MHDAEQIIRIMSFHCKGSWRLRLYISEICTHYSPAEQKKYLGGNGHLGLDLGLEGNVFDVLRLHQP